MQRLIGLDLGSKTCGIAISDPLGMIARALTTVRFESDDYEQALHDVLEICKENKVTEVVLGLPRHMNGDVGIRGQISEDFARKLEENGIKTNLWDERLTTVSANRLLISGDVKRKKRKQIIDQMAAVQILQSYLDRQNGGYVR